MKLTKQQLKQIIKEELENVFQLNENMKSINNFATEIGVAPLEGVFTNQELVDFVNNILASSPALPPIQPGTPDAAEVEAEMDPRWPGETDKHYEQRFQKAIKQTAGRPSAAIHPLTSTRVGFDLEAILNNRKTKACDPSRQDPTGYDDCPLLYKALEDLRKVVGAKRVGTTRSGSGPQRYQRTSAGIERERRLAMGAASERAADWQRQQRTALEENKMNKSQIKQIIKEELEKIGN